LHDVDGFIEALAASAHSVASSSITRTSNRAADRAREAALSPGASEQLIQILLRQQYRDLASRGGPSLDFNDVEFCCNSQNGEDGILLYIFSLIGTTNRMVLEICAGDGIECNASNLILNHGFDGLLFDGDAQLIERGRAFYAAHANSRVRPPQLVGAWITAETINDQVTAHGFSGDIDLLSLDLDGNDYWIWKALTLIRPRVVVLEFNADCSRDHVLQAGLSMGAHGNAQPLWRIAVRIRQVGS